MRRVLIADPYIKDSGYMETIQNSFTGVLEFAFCFDGNEFHTIMNEFDPELLFISAQIPNANGVELLRDIRSVGNTIPAILTIQSLDDYVASSLLQLNIGGVLRSPFSVESVIQELCKISGVMELYSDWSAEKEIEYILFRLGFKASCTRFENIRYGVLEKYKSFDISTTKELYPKVAKLVGKKASCVEKAIRDGVRMAYSSGDQGLWRAYFPLMETGKNPTNEEFLSRMAIALRNRQRPKKAM